MYNHQVDTFLKVAELGSFGKAAEALYISVPAAIQQVNLLEERCGLKLFVRSNHGVKLTPAGRSLAEDARTIVRLSHEALDKAKRLAESAETTVRIATALLFKCRLLPTIWTAINSQFPELKIEILPMGERQERENAFFGLGKQYDLWEGIYADTAWTGRCHFLELIRTPICCAVSKGHRLAKATRLRLDDLNGEYLVMPIEGLSYELDALRSETRQKHPTLQIIDSTYYGVDTFTLCEVNPYILITQAVYADIHPDLVTIPLDVPYTMPYGLIYANEPTPATEKFIRATTQVAEKGMLQL